MAFAEPVAVVDGNVRRVVSRLKAWENPIPTEVQRTAQELLSLPHPGEWNQALMELGSLVCTPQNPRCAECPIRRWCKGKANPSQYPTPKVRKPKALEVVALVLVGPEGVHLEARRGRILGGLWGVPMQENPGGLEHLLAQFGLSRAESCGTIQHAFTHRKLSVQVYRADWNGQEQPGQRPLSRLDQKVLGCAGVFL
jgi:A/G-specific adenine glycosylase